MAGSSPTGKGAGAAGFGAAALLVCCGSHLLVVSVLGGLAVGTVLGLVAGVLALVALVAALLIVHRRRRRTFAVPRARTPVTAVDTPASPVSATVAASPSSAPGRSGEPRPEETPRVA